MKTKNQEFELKGKVVEKLSLPLLEDRIAAMEELADRRKTAAREEKEAREEVANIMEENDIESYQLQDGRTVKFEKKTKITIKDSIGELAELEEE